MEQRWDEFAAAIRSGNSEQVNETIDEIEELDLDERVQLFETCFNEVTSIYAQSDNGYVRQSTVRVAEQLTPGIALVFAVAESDQSIEAGVGTVREQTDEIGGFLLEALTDEDGRVRQSAKRGLKDVFRTYDSLEDEKAIEAFAVELDEMATEYSDKRRKHLLETKEDAEFFLQSGFGRLLEGFQKEFGDSLEK
ncbi:hypothetical protein GWG54_18035 [Natronococcus sp. JC468]|uniref:hypothetical protein n=1 Tax=Natronococcus sp. JC468 TaxID=1961921 RepID=UPI00143BE115|nr:hypothetical protein [Natronococcus sp. JC468]NKE37670.1 hypothetical protein [Natronococcus sp. JC468]